MTTNVSICNLRRVSLAVSLAGLTVGIASLPFDSRVAMLPAALVFGWSQIGSH